MRQCSRCYSNKDVSEFYIDKSRPRGYVSRCKTCYKEMHREYRKHPTKCFSEYKSNAKRRGIEWRLSKEEFIGWLWQAPCYFCGANIETIGIDRMNNEPYYDITNAIPCCFTCNAMKSGKPLRLFLEQCQKIALRVAPVDLKDFDSLIAPY